MNWNWYAIGGALLAAAACSFFFALAESALFALGRFRVRQMAEDAPRAGRRLAFLFQRPEDLIATVALGNTFANATVIGLAVWVLAHTGWPKLALGAGAFFLILIGCEFIPKALGVRAPEFWSTRVAGPMSAVVTLTLPLRRIAQAFNESLLRLIIPPSVQPQPSVSEEEYQDVLDIAHEQGALGKAEKEIIVHILSLDQRTAGDVMKPRSRISCISDELSREEMLEAARKIGHTRIPIYDETPDTIVGVLNARAFLLNPELELEEVIEMPSFVPQSMNLLQLLRSLRRQRRGLAIVLDEFGGTAGLVTMEDILEEMLGPFQRKPTDRPVIERLAPGKWRVDGACLIEEFRRECPDLPECREVDTMGGLLIRQIEYVPSAGESATLRGLRLTAAQVDERRVRQLEVEVLKR